MVVLVEVLVLTAGVALTATGPPIVGPLLPAVHSTASRYRSITGGVSEIALPVSRITSSGFRRRVADSNNPSSTPCRRFSSFMFSCVGAISCFCNTFCLSCSGHFNPIASVLQCSHMKLM
uniref:Putative secreted peptide n=1 Tax=Anopheles braziliensis TaxID=58242 RepID=A0A2M3ZXE3_9DIPT